MKVYMATKLDGSTREILGIYASMDSAVQSVKESIEGLTSETPSAHVYEDFANIFIKQAETRICYGYVMSYPVYN